MQESSQQAADFDHSIEKLGSMPENVFWIRSPSGQIIYVSPAYEKIWGRPCQDLYKFPDSFIDTIHEDDRPYVIEKLSKEKTEKWSSQYRIVRPDGSIHWVHDSSFPIFDENRKVCCIQGIAIDITAYKDMEHRLRYERDNLRNILGAMEDGVYIVDKDYNLIYGNPALEKIFGPYEDKKCYQYFHDREESCLGCRNEEVFAGKTIRWQWRSLKTGRVYDVIDTLLKRDNDETLKLEILRDITDRQIAEKALQESEKKYRLIFESAANLIMSVNKEGVILDCNSRSESVLGYKKDELLNQPMSKIFHPDYLEEARHCLAEVLTQGFVVNKENKMVCKDNKIIDVVINASALAESINGYTQTICIIEDVTEHKQLEEKLRESEAKYHALIEGASDAIVITDLEGNFIEVNEKAQELLGYSREEFKNINVYKIHPPEIKEQIMEYFKNVIENGYGIFKTLPAIKKDDTKIDVDITASIIEYRGKKVAQALLRDVSWRRKVDQMKDNLVRDISHELKTPIATLEMAYDMCQRGIKYSDWERVKKSQNIALHNINRLRKDINNILNLALLSKKLIEKETVDLKSIVDDVIDDLKYSMEEKGLSVEVDIAADAKVIKISPRELKTLLYNLVDNAVKFTNQGSISITSRLKEGWLELTIKDTGCGVEAMDKDKIFSKFYQQKSAVAGTGLGLSICREVVERYKGKIDFYSEGKGKGTTFLIMFPQEEGQRNR